MKLLSAASRYLFLCVVVLGAVDASALTLGRLRGAALLGQPLQVSVPVQFSPDEDVSASCFQAEVFYGDMRQESQGVSIRVETRDEGQPALVRIRSANRVDEPVVTVTLRAVCEQRTSRRYVLLADLPSEVSPSVTGETIAEVTAANVTKVQTPAALPTPSVAVSAPAAVPSASALPAKNSSGAGSSIGIQERPKKLTKKAESTTPGALADRKLTPPARELKPRSRLKLAPLELGPEKDPVLKSTDSLLYLEPLENLQKRAEAVAAWRALNTTAEDVLRQEARSQAVEGDLKTLKDLTVRNQQSLAEVAGRLEQAERERYANPLVYILVVLLLAAATAAVLFWQRLRDSGSSAGPWWGGEDVQAERAIREKGANAGTSPIPHQSFPPSENFAQPDQSQESPTAQKAVPGGLLEVDLPLGDSVFGNLGAADTVPSVPRDTVPAQVQAVAPPTAAPAQSAKDFGASVSGALRAINTREMLDVRQQAEFFMTLGQYEEAISALANSIEEGDSANPLVYLDLLKIFHTLSRKTEYDRYREEFNQEFSGRVPVYVGFNQGGKPLEAYQDIVEQIASLWPTEACLEYIESCLVRKPQDPQERGFDLEAFRDLLMLHGIVRRLDGLTESAMVPFSAMRQAPVAVVGVAQPTMTVPDPSGPQPTAVDLDLDLSAAPGNISGDNLIDFDLSGFSKLGDLSKEP